jgi:hypothetical protein
MPKEKGLPLMLSIPKECRDRLREIAARENLNNPDQVTSASTIAREIICGYLDGVGAKVDQNRIGGKKK